jgi:hypothetical protein
VELIELTAPYGDAEYSREVFNRWIIQATRERIIKDLKKIPEILRRVIDVFRRPNPDIERMEALNFIPSIAIYLQELRKFKKKILGLDEILQKLEKDLPHPLNPLATTF